MFSVELAIAVFVFMGLLVAVKEYFVQIDNQRQQEALDQELEAMLSRRNEPVFKIRASDDNT